MKTTFGFALVLLSAAPSLASVDRFYKLYDLDARGVESRVKEAIAQVEKDCAFSMFSRIGPRPGEVARCNKAEEKAISMGSSAARMALVRIDDEKTDPSVRWRLYDVVARVGDLSYVEPMIRALEKNDAHGLSGERRYETHVIAQTLGTLTYAELKGTPSIQWRAWYESHKGQTRSELLAARREEARAQIATATVDVATSAAHFLAMQPATRAEGVAALEALVKRPGLTASEKVRIEALLRQVPKAPAQVAANAPAA